VPFTGRGTASTSADSNEEVFYGFTENRPSKERLKEDILDAQGKLSHSLDVHVK
jgi:hypothetical protein